MRSPARSPVASARGRAYDRHSATGTRGLPKKNGAGGKGVWGAAMDQEGVAYLDKNDPNYDPDEEVEVVPPQLNLGPPKTDNAPAAESDSAATTPPAENPPAENPAQ